MSEIDTKYASLPNAAEILGNPTGPEGNALNGGRFRHYDRGSIYYLPGVGAFEVHGAIHQRWADSGWERGILGYPTTDETGTPDNVGRFNHFQHGSIYWTPATGAHEVHGGVHDLWSVSGWEQGPGYPTTDVVTLPEFASIDVCWFTHQIVASPSIAHQAFAFDQAMGALLVVAPNNDFVAAAEPFLAHKRATGIPTFLHVLSADESAGETAPFQLKGRIAEAAVWLNVRWVMLLGDAGLIPTRHRCTSGIPAGHLTTAWYTPTDFYYADLFPGGVRRVVPVDSTPTWIAPDSWDANGDARFNEHHWASDTRDFNPDNVQAIPWVAIGRVPAHDASQAADYLAKVITYESGQPAGATRFSILIDYDYYNEPQGPVYLAPTLLDRAGQPPTQIVDIVGLDWPQNAPPPPGLRPGERWSTWMATASSRYVTYIGHGGPSEWDVTNPLGGKIDGPTVDAFQNPTNTPVVLAAGCETSPVMINAPEEGRYLGIDGQAHDYAMIGSTVVDREAPPPPAPLPAPIAPVRPSPFDFSTTTPIGFAYHWLCNPNGGAIAYFGEAAVAPDTSAVELLGRVLGHLWPGTILGDAWMEGQNEYRTVFGAPDNPASQDPQSAPRIYLTYMHLFGDPSLRVW